MPAATEPDEQQPVDAVERAKSVSTRKAYGTMTTVSTKTARATTRHAVSSMRFTRRK
jgi:hypothetical protein